jgi:predicted RNase H-like nuclease
LPLAVGVDGARSGWIAVWQTAGAFRYALYDDPAALCAAHPAASVIAVDIPIGLSDSLGRAPDALARRFVGGRRACSIFSAPVRGILDAASQPEASRRHRAIDGRGFGAQSFAILAKIRVWDDLLQRQRGLRAVVREVPEVSFAALNGGVGLIESKKKAPGQSLRKALLAGHFGLAAIDDLVRAVPRGQAATDDVLDALVALWSAERMLRGEAKSLPAPPTIDATGLATAIWY